MSDMKVDRHTFVIQAVLVQPKFQVDSIACLVEPVRFEDRRFLINYNKDDLKCVKLVDRLIEELMGFGVVFDHGKTGDMTGTTKFQSVKAHDDIVMACALGYWGCKEQLTTGVRILRTSHKQERKLLLRT